jgi:hypothetical protein
VLVDMADRLATAKNIDEVLGSHMPSNAHGYGS